MSIRAVIFDVYETLLQVGPPPPDAPARWELLWEDSFADPARLTLEEFDSGTRKIIERMNGAARARGVRFPEVDWTVVAREVLPELSRVSDAKAGDFLFAHAQLVSSVHMAQAAGGILRSLHGENIPLGIASNSQAYTQRELDGALAALRLDRTLFEPDLCFWSFERGFSKPDIQVCSWLAERLAKRDIPVSATLMVGDRQDNDILPARAAGWQAWRLTPPGATEDNVGDWQRLEHFLQHQLTAT